MWEGGLAPGASSNSPCALSTSIAAIAAPGAPPCSVASAWLSAASAAAARRPCRAPPWAAAAFPAARKRAAASGNRPSACA